MCLPCRERSEDLGYALPLSLFRAAGIKGSTVASCSCSSRNLVSFSRTPTVASKNHLFSPAGAVESEFNSPTGNITSFSIALSLWNRHLSAREVLVSRRLERTRQISPRRGLGFDPEKSAPAPTPPLKIRLQQNFGSGCSPHHHTAVARVCVPASPLTRMSVDIFPWSPG